MLSDHYMSMSHSLHYARWVGYDIKQHAICMNFVLDAHYAWMTRCGPKVSQIGSKLDKSGTFSDQISVHFGSSRSEKSRFLSFGANLTHFGSKSDISGVYSFSIVASLNNIVYHRRTHASLLPSLLTSLHIV